LRPVAFNDSKSLIDAIKRFIEIRNENKDVSIELNVNGNPFFIEPNVEDNLFRITQEAVNNALRHSKADLINIDVRFASDFINITIRDNGIGFDTNDTYDGHIGLSGMKTRAKEIGAILKLTSNKDAGTTVDLTL
jgi:signal transduction histidine kinase